MAYTQADLKYYKNNPEEITSSLDTELILELIDHAPENIQRIKPQTMDLVQRAYERDPQVFEHVDFGIITLPFLDRVIEEHPKYIRYIYSPSPEMIKRALELDFNVMPYVDDGQLDESVYEWLVERNGLALQYVPVKFQTLRMTELAIQNNIDAYEFAHVKSKETDIYVVERDPSKIPLITDYWPELIDIFIEYNPRYITKFYKDEGFVTRERLKRALTLEPEIFKTIPNPDREIMRFTLSLEIDMFVYMPYSTDLLEYALETNGLILKYYKKKDLRTIKAALNLNVRSLDYLQYPRQFLIDYAFQQDGYALKYLRDPTYDQCLDAVKRNWMAIEFIKPEFKTKDVQLFALASGGTDAIPFIGPPAHDDVIMVLLNLEPSFIFKVGTPTSEMYKNAFKSEGALILFFPNWNTMFNADEIAAALSQDGTIFEHVRYKSKRLALVAIEQYPPAIQWTMSFQDLEIARAAVNGDPRTLFFVRKDVLDTALLKLALELDPEYFTRTSGEMSWQEWIDVVGFEDDDDEEEI